MTEYYYATHSDLYILKTPGPEVARGLMHRTQHALLRRLQTSGRKLEVCSINCLSKHKEIDDKIVPELLSQVDIPPEQGGWRPADEDMICLQVAAFQPMNALLGLEDMPQKLFMSHPAVKGGVLFPFTCGLPLQFFSVLKSIYDIRRFVDLDKPQRRFKLRSFFSSATPTVFFKIVKGNEMLPNDLAGAQVALDAWYDARPGHTLSEQLVKPRDFFHRKYFETSQEMERRQYSEEKACAIGLWKATVSFIDFVQMTWESGLGLSKFDPVGFFDTEAEVEEFYRFIKRLDNTVDISQLMDKQ